MSGKIGLANPLINGSYGPYGNWPDKLTQDQKSANAGNKVANSILSGINQIDSRTNKTIVYSDMNGAYDDPNRRYFRAPDPELSTKSALAYSTEALTKYDKNKDGVVSTNEFGQYKPGQTGEYTTQEFNETGDRSAKAIDLNNDGKIDAGEYTAYTIYQDGATNYGYGFNWDGTTFDKDKVDGKVTKEEAQRANKELKNSPGTVKSDLQEIYKSFGIADAQKNFKMPRKEGEEPVDDTDPPVTQPKNQDFMQIILMLMMMMFGFGGQQQNQGNYYGNGGNNLFVSPQSNGNFAW